MTEIFEDRDVAGAVPNPPDNHQQTLYIEHPLLGVVKWMPFLFA